MLETAAAPPELKPEMTDVIQPSWRFLTSHALVLLAIHRDPDIRMRDLAAEIGITERRAQEIVSELVGAGFLARERVGRRNRYGVRADLRIRHPDWGEHNLGDVLSLAAMWTGLGRDSAANRDSGDGWSAAEEEQGGEENDDAR
ncbi:MAG: hypothetical protein QOG09_1038 [Solirubrobacterales bacterium]|nr:hypothetical protein [Solirubrobacterales bacterium]